MAFTTGASVALIVKRKIIRRFAETSAFNESTAKTLQELDLENKHKVILSG